MTAMASRGQGPLYIVHRGTKRAQRSPRCPGAACSRLRARSMPWPYLLHGFSHRELYGLAYGLRARYPELTG